jgi:hypothetical protein
MNVTILHVPSRGGDGVRFEVAAGLAAPALGELRLYSVAWIGFLSSADLGFGDVNGPFAALEALWQLVEHGGTRCPIPRVMGHPDGPIRSFVTGDVVLLDGVPYYCAEIGWEMVKLPRTICQRDADAGAACG